MQQRGRYELEWKHSHQPLRGPGDEGAQAPLQHQGLMAALELVCRVIEYSEGSRIYVYLRGWETGEVRLVLSVASDRNNFQ